MTVIWCEISENSAAALVTREGAPRVPKARAYIIHYTKIILIFHSFLFSFCYFYFKNFYRKIVGWILFLWVDLFYFPKLFWIFIFCYYFLEFIAEKKLNLFLCFKNILGFVYWKYPLIGFSLFLLFYFLEFIADRLIELFHYEWIYFIFQNVFDFYFIFLSAILFLGSHCR